MGQKKTELLGLRFGVLLLAAGVMGMSGCKANETVTRSPRQNFQNQNPLLNPLNSGNNLYDANGNPASGVANAEWQKQQEKRQADLKAAQDKKAAEQKKLDDFRKSVQDSLKEKYGLSTPNDCPLPECQGPEGEVYRKIWAEEQQKAKNLADINKTRQAAQPEIKYQTIAPWVVDARALGLKELADTPAEDTDHDGIPNATEIALRKSNPVKYAMLDPNLANGYRSMVRTYTEDDLETAAGTETVSGWKKFGVSANDIMSMAGIRLSEHDNLFNLKLANVFEIAPKTKSSLEVGRGLWKAGILPVPQVAGNEYGSFLKANADLLPSVILGVSPSLNDVTAVLKGGWVQPLFFNAADGPKGDFVYDVITGLNSNTQTVIEEGDRFGVMIEWYGRFPNGADVLIGGAQQIDENGMGHISPRAAAAFLLLQNENLVATSLNLSKKYTAIKNGKIADNGSCPSKFTAFLWTKSDKDPTEWIRENIFVKESGRSDVKYDLFQQHTAVAAYPEGGFKGCNPTESTNLVKYEVLDAIGYKGVASDPSIFKPDAPDVKTPSGESTTPSGEAAPTTTFDVNASKLDAKKALADATEALATIIKNAGVKRSPPSAEKPKDKNKREAGENMIRYEILRKSHNANDKAKARIWADAWKAVEAAGKAKKQFDAAIKAKKDDDAAKALETLKTKSQEAVNKKNDFVKLP